MFPLPNPTGYTRCKRRMACWRMTYTVLLLCLGMSMAFDFLPKDIEIKSNKDLLAVGEALEVDCSLKRNVSGILELHHRGRDLSKFVTFRNDHRVKVVIPKVGLQHNGTYHCYVANNSLPVSTFIHVAYPPPKPQNIQCVSLNLENMTCTWDPVKTAHDLNIVTNWTLYYTISLDSSVRKKNRFHTECPVPGYNLCSWPASNHRDPRKSFKSWGKYYIKIQAKNSVGKSKSLFKFVNPKHKDLSAVDSSSPSGSACHNKLSNNGCQWYLHDPISTQYSFKPGYVYLIWIQANSHLGSTTSNKQIVKTRDIVKITPPVEVKAVTGNRSSLVKVSWKMTFSPSGYLPLVYNISIICSNCLQQQRWQSGGLKFHSGDGPWIETATLTDLEPFVKYRFTVQVKTKRHGYWSEVSRPTSLRTLEDAPVGSPVFMNSSFTVISTSEKDRQIIVYWQSPDVRLRSGLLMEYKLRIKGKPANLVTKVIPSASSLLSLETDSVYWVDIAAATVKGYGPYSAGIIIHKQAKVPPTVTMVTAQANETSVMIFWERPELESNIMGYTVHFCKGELTNNGVVVARCEEDYQWENLKPDHINTTVHMTRDKLKSYVFGVSMETEMGSSGIKWCQCVFSWKGAPSQLQELTAVVVRETTVWLSWEKLRCMASQARVLSFQVTWCDWNCECGQGSLVNVSGSWDLDHTQIVNLHPGTNYSACIRTVGERGAGPWSTPVYLQTRIPVPWALIVGCTLGVISLLLILGVWLWIWRFVKSPLPHDIPIPKAVEELVCMNYEDDRKTEQIKAEQIKGDNQYTVIGEEQPLMCDDPGNVGGKCKLQHFPVSHDSGNDSLSEESSQGHHCVAEIAEKMAALDTSNRLSSSLSDVSNESMDTDKNIEDMNKEAKNNEDVNNENDLNKRALLTKENVWPKNKRESGYFDDMATNGPEGIMLHNSKPMETRIKPDVSIICPVQQPDDTESTNTTNSYSRFCKADGYIDSGSSVVSTISDTSDSYLKFSSPETLSRIPDPRLAKHTKNVPMDSEKRPLISEILENTNSNNCKTDAFADLEKQDTLEFGDVPDGIEDELDYTEMFSYNPDLSVHNDVVPYVQMRDLGNMMSSDRGAQNSPEEEQNMCLSADEDSSASGHYLPHEMIPTTSPITEPDLTTAGYSKLATSSRDNAYLNV